MQNQPSAAALRQLAMPSPLLRQMSVRSVMETILQLSPVSRATVAELTGLSKQTVSAVVAALEREGWVHAVGHSRRALGRTAVTYRIREDAAFVLAVDLGASKLHAALADFTGRCVAEEIVATERSGGLPVIAQLGTVYARLLERAGVPGSAVRLAVLGTPGVAEPGTGRVALAPNIPGLDQIDLLSAASETLGMPVHVENDANLAVLGEHWHRGRGAGANLAFLAVGTGIGMGLMVNGALVRGASGAAGEVSYLPLGADPFEAESRRAGALERAVSAGAIVARYESLGGQRGLSVRDLFARAAEDDKVAAQSLEEAARLVALALVAVSAVADPGRVVLGGSIGMRPEFVARLRAALPAAMARPVPVEASLLGNRACLIGAIAVGLNQLHNALFGMPDLPSALPLPSAPPVQAAAVPEEAPLVP